MYYWLNVSQENKGIISTFLSVVLLASSPILYKFGLGNIYPIHAATLWFVCNTIFSIINIDLRKIIIEKKVFSKLLVISACSSSALVFLFYSLAILDPSTVAFANRSYILFIILLGIIALKERVQKIQLYFIALNIIGLFLFAYKGLDYSHYAPIIYAILSAFLFAYSNMQSKLILKVITPSFVNFYSNLLSSILLCPFFFLEDIRNLSLNSSIIYILVASFTGGGYLGMLLFYKGLNSHSLVIAGVIRAFSPLLTTLYALPFFKISYSVINIIGIILLLISSLVLSNEVLGKIELFYANLKKSVT